MDVFNKLLNCRTFDEKTKNGDYVRKYKRKYVGRKDESLLDENKMLRELLKSALDENKKFCEDLELKQKEVDSYKKMNIEGKEEYGNLRKLYDGAKAEEMSIFACIRSSSMKIRI